MLERLFRHFYTSSLRFFQEACSVGSGYCCSAGWDVDPYLQRPETKGSRGPLVIPSCGSRLVISHL